MKYLFIVQGEGRGHMTQAITLRNILTENGHEVVEVLVGTSPNRIIPSFFKEKIKTAISTFRSPNFSPNQKTKRSSTFYSILFNIPRLHHYINSIKFIKKKIKSLNPDRVINFYDVLGGLTFHLYRIEIPMICIAHQYIFLHKDFKFPNKSKSEIAGLLFFTRLTCLGAKKVLALSFGNYSSFDDEVFQVVPPLLREEVRNAKSTEGDFILGYLLNSSFESEIRTWHEENKKHALRFFWDNKSVKDDITVIDETLSFHKLNDIEFINNMKCCKAYATTGGFESICEALYLQKPVLMVPAHIEQECNVMDAMSVGAGISDYEFNLIKLIHFTPHYKPYTSFQRWTQSANESFIYHLTAPIEESVKIERYFNQIWMKAFYNKDMYSVLEPNLFFETISKPQTSYDISLINS